MNNKQKETILSIVIPVFNNDRYIAFCLDSLLVHQSASKELYEIVIVNDGSTDNSRSIIQSYEKKYSNIIVINQENSGVSVARNNGMAICNGNFVWFVDGDDCVKANCIESILCKLNANIELYHFNGYSFRDDEFYESIIFEKFEGEQKPWFVTFIISLPFLRKNNIVFEKGIHYCEDQIFMNDVFLRNPICISDNCIYYYCRKNDYSVTATNRQRKVTGYFDLFQLLENRLKNEDYPVENTLHQIESILRMRFLHAMEDMSIVTSEQINRGRKLSEFLSHYISTHNIPKNYRKAFKDYEKLCSHCEDENWKRYLYHWRKSFYRKKWLKKAVQHPKKTVISLLKSIIHKPML